MPIVIPEHMSAKKACQTQVLLTEFTKLHQTITNMQNPSIPKQKSYLRLVPKGYVYMIQIMQTELCNLNRAI